MRNSVIVLGAKGRFGRAAITAFKARGWSVSALARSWKTEEKIAGVENVTANAFDREALTRACMDHDVIVNAINPPYEAWEKSLPKITENVIAAAIAAKATVMIPGNVYNYGNQLPGKLTEKTPHIPNTKKGRLRIEMEQAYKDAAEEGLKTILLRGGDFIEGKDTGNWFETYITSKLNKGVVTYPGPVNQVHSWAYLPDMANVMAELAEKRHTISVFEEFGYRGLAITGSELVKALEVAAGKNLRVKSFPWPIIKIMGLFSKQIHEVLEMRYLWNRPHEIDDTKLRKALPDFETMSADEVIRRVVSGRQGGKRL